MPTLSCIGIPFSIIFKDVNFESILLLGKPVRFVFVDVSILIQHIIIFSFYIISVAIGREIGSHFPDVS